MWYYMRIGILSDIHSNYTALRAVTRQINRESIDQLVCLGDIIGYGPRPEKCCSWVRKNVSITVQGNHDAAVCNTVNRKKFNRVAEEALSWTCKHMSKKNRQFLASLPLIATDLGVTFVHASPVAPERFTYIISASDAGKQFDFCKTALNFFGHTHHQEVFVQDREGMVSRHAQSAFTISSGKKYLVNPGSVGQPRDGIPKAAYAVYDTNAQKLRLKRVPYPIEVVQRRLRRAHLPQELAVKLMTGT